MTSTHLDVLSEEEATLLPGDDDVAFYHDHGYWQTGKIFTDEEINAAVTGSERFYAGERNDFPPPHGREIPEGWVPDQGDGLRKNDYASLQNRPLAALVRKPLLGAIAARLAGAPIRLWHDQLLYKPPTQGAGSANVGWHTDRQYWRTCTSDNMLTAWIPFHDSFEEQGTITMIDGSHRWPDMADELDFFNVDLNALEARFNSKGEAIVKVPMNLPKGHVSFHHCRTIHGSGPNRGTTPRRSIAVHLQDDANRYREFRDARGNLAGHVNNRLCLTVDGHPDFTDPEVCPPLWPVGSTRLSADHQ